MNPSSILNRKLGLVNLPSSNLTELRNVVIDHYPYNMVIFHSYVSLPEGKISLSIQLDPVLRHRAPRQTRIGRCPGASARPAASGSP